MRPKLSALFRHAVRFVWSGSVAVFLTLVVVFVLLMNNRPDLSIWHLAELDEEFTVDSEVSSFSEHLPLLISAGIPRRYSNSEKCPGFCVLPFPVYPK